jgi:WD40 repeat protein
VGRPERPVDPEAGPVQRLAHELRELRKAAGGPSYRRMAETADFSATTLSQAAAGERLPSLDVVRGYVRACGADLGEWEASWKAAEAELSGAVREEAAHVPPPYRGLARFEPDDHHLFFGRDRMAEQLDRLVCDHRFAVLFGASGSGKSSLLRAGLIPRLREEIARRDNPAVLRVLTPGTRPAERYGHLLAPAPDEPESWVVVDQFEEAFTLCRDPAERARFIDLLLAARDPGNRLRVLVTVRADFYARCSEHRGLADALTGAGLLLGPMTADELREAVIRPAQAAGHLVERELTARIVEEVLDQPGSLPMLSHALLETWRRRKGRLLTLAAYEAAGGVRGAIAATAEEVYGRLEPALRGAARRLLLRMVEPGQGTPDTRRPLTRAELDEWADPDVPEVVDRLARARLLTADEDGVQFAHEALITCWPRLHRWIEEDRDRLRHHRHLTEAARVWWEHDRDPGDLYRGSRLERTEEYFPGHATDRSLTAAERAFLVAAFEARESERRTAARTARRSRTLLAGLSAVLVVAVVAGLSAWQLRRDNDDRRTADTARRVADVADALRTTDPRLAQLLGVAAWHVDELPETRRALLGSLAQPELDTFTDPAPGETPARFLTDSGRTLLSVEGRTWRRWNVPDHRRVAEGRLPTADLPVAASPDGRVLALSGSEGVRLWDTKTGRWTGDTDHPAPPDATVDLTEAGYVVAEDDRVELRTVEDGRLLFAHDSDGAVIATACAPPSSRGAGPYSMCGYHRAGATSPHRAAAKTQPMVLICPSAEAAPRLWSGDQVHPGDWQNAKDICGDNQTLLALGPDRLAAVTAEGIRVWDLTSGKRLADLTRPGIGYAAFSKGGDFLATADGAEIQVWRLSAPDAPVFRHALNNQHLYRGLYWDPDHPTLRYLEGGTVHSLDLTQAVTSAWRKQPMAGVLLSPDGHLTATAERVGDGYRFQLRATADGKVVRTLPSPPFPVSQDPARPITPSYTMPLMAFGPDGRTLAYGVSAPGYEAAPQRTMLWDVEEGSPRGAVDLATGGSTEAVTGLALDRNGRTLYAARSAFSGALTDEVWDTARHRRLSVVAGLTSGHLAVRPDGRLLVGDNRVARLPGGKVVGRNLVQGDQIGALAFSEDGALLAVGDQTGRVALWDGDVRHRAGVLRNVFPAPRGGTPEAVTALAVSPDGRTLAVGGAAGSLQLWDVTTQQPLGGPLTTPGEQLDTLAFAADGSTLYAGGAHVPLQRYAVDPGRAVARVCARVGGAQLTRAQWRTYVPDVPYRKVCGRD